jgi:hypothetical protein
MINKDIVYIVCFILILINCILYNKQKKPVYINNPIFKLLFLVCIMTLSYLNLYISTFLAITFLTIYQ